MYFQQIVPQLINLPVFESSLLYAGTDTPQQAQRRLSDWVRSGKAVQLRRGLYTVSKQVRAEHSTDVESPHSYVIANHMVRGSYISLHIALSHYSLIPEHVAVITSVTTGRPRKWQNEFGRFAYQHIQPEFFFGFQYRQVTQTQWAYMATPEKALLDLIYLTPDADNAKYIRTLRLQNLEQLNIVSLKEYVARMDKPKLRRALPHILQAIENEAHDYVSL